MQSLLRWFALVASLAAVVLLLFIPFYEGVSVHQSVGGSAVQRSQTATLIAVNGTRALLILVVPVLAAVSALLPWPPRFRRSIDVLGATAVTAFVLLGGLFFVPAAAALIAIALWPRKSHPAR